MTEDGIVVTKIVVDGALVIVEKKAELSLYGELEQIGPNEFYTGRWPYRGYFDKKKIRDGIYKIAERKNADVVLCEHDKKNKSFFVKFFRRKKEEEKCRRCQHRLA